MNKLPPRWTDRHGNHSSKTAKDHRSGAHERNARNKQERADWQNDTHRGHTLEGFPWHTCNGKRNKSIKEATKKKTKAI